MKKWKLVLNQGNTFFNATEEKVIELLKSIKNNQLPLFLYFKEEAHEEQEWVLFNPKTI